MNKQLLFLFISFQASLLLGKPTPNPLKPMFDCYQSVFRNAKFVSNLAGLDQALFHGQSQGVKGVYLFTSNEGFFCPYKGGSPGDNIDFKINRSSFVSIRSKVDPVYFRYFPDNDISPGIRILREGGPVDFSKPESIKLQCSSSLSPESKTAYQQKILSQLEWYLSEDLIKSVKPHHIADMKSCAHVVGPIKEKYLELQQLPSKSSEQSKTQDGSEANHRTPVRKSHY